MLAVLVRVPGITRPLVGNFATKNAVYAMIARNWALERAPLTQPTVDAIAGGNRALHLVEFPVSAYISGSLWRALGGSLDVWGRLTAVALSAIAVVYLYRLAAAWHGPQAAAAAAAVYALSPVSIIYGQSFMLEPSVACLSLAVVWHFDRWLSGRHPGSLVVAASAIALLLLSKIYMVVLLIPLGAMLLQTRERRQRRAAIIGLGAIGLASLPAIAWYTGAMAAAAPDGELAGRIFYSVRDSAGAHRPPHPLLWQPAFYAGVLHDLGTVALAPLGAVLCLLGLAQRECRRHLPWLIAMAILVLALPRKFAEMNYYYLVILPPLSLIAGLGWRALAIRFHPTRAAVAACLFVGLALSLRYAVRPAFVTPAEDRGVVAAAQQLRTLAAEDERVITIHGSTLDLLYYSEQPGWALSAGNPQLAEHVARCRRDGARLLALAYAPGSEHRADRDQLAALCGQSRVVARGEGFCIYQLPPFAARPGAGDALADRWARRP